MPNILYEDLKLWYKANRNSTGVTHSQIPSDGTGNGTFSNGGNNLATLVRATCPALSLAYTSSEIRDAWQIENLISNGIITDKEFTFYIDFDVTDRNNGSNVITFHNSGGFKMITIGLSGGNPDKYRVRADISALPTWIPSTTSTISGFVKMIIKYDGGNLSLFINGIKQGSNPESFTDVIDEIRYNSIFQGATQIEEIAMWNFPKTDAECLELTRT